MAELILHSIITRFKTFYPQAVAYPVHWFYRTRTIFMFFICIIGSFCYFCNHIPNALETPMAKQVEIVKIAVIYTFKCSIFDLLIQNKKAKTFAKNEIFIIVSFLRI